MAGAAFAADPGPITQFANITVAPQPSVPLNTIAVLPSNGDNATVTYNFSVFAGDSFSQTIPVEFCQTSTGGSTWSSYDMGILASNGSTLVVPTATPIQFANGEVSCKTLDIEVNTGPLLLQNPTTPVIRQRLIRLVKTAQAPAAPDVRGRNEGFDGYKPSSMRRAHHGEPDPGIGRLLADGFIGRVPRRHQRRPGDGIGQQRRRLHARRRALSASRRRDATRCTRRCSRA